MPVPTDSSRSTPPRWWRRPTLHFALLGAALFGGYALQPDVPAPAVSASRPTVTITAAKVAALRNDFAQSTGRQPDRDEEQALLAKAIDEELLYREALALGLDQNDRSVEWRLAEKMRFVEGEEGCGGEGGEDTAALAQEARALGLEHDDPVLRRQMIHKLRLLPRAAGADDAADDAALRAYYEQHREQYRQPGRVSLTQVFLSRAARGDRLESEAAALLARLRAEQTAAGAAAAFGDASTGGPSLTASSRNQIRKHFGDTFADAVFALPTGAWQGPVRSPYGLHLVLIHDRQDARVPDLADVASQVRRQMTAERRLVRLNELLAELRAKYDVRIETAPTA